MKPLPLSDITFMLERLEDAFAPIKGAQWFITGATGLIGRWLLELLMASNQQFNTHFQITALSRDPSRFVQQMPHLSDNPWVDWVKGDVASFVFPTRPLDFIIHAAAEVQSSDRAAPSLTFAKHLLGTQRVIELCKRNPDTTLLYTSSGAVYGKIPSELTHVSETYLGAPNPLEASSAYGQGKRTCEFLLAAAHQEFGLNFKISRTFAVVGPHLPLDKHYAIGNFINDGLQGNPIRVLGDGSSTRSYLYLAEHTVWLIKILLLGQTARAYNVGSDISHSIGEVANLVSWNFGSLEVKVTQSSSEDQAISRYVPSIERVKQELQVSIEIPLPEAIARTVGWHHNQKEVA